jgi:hypothetical protein
MITNVADRNDDGSARKFLHGLYHDIPPWWLGRRRSRNRAAGIETEAM